MPLSQSLLAFNELARANGFPAKALSLEEIDIFTRESRVPSALAEEKEMKQGAGKLYCSGGARGRFVSPYLMAPIR